MAEVNRLDGGHEPILDQRMISRPTGFVMLDPETGRMMSLAEYLKLHPRRERESVRELPILRRIVNDFLRVCFRRAA